MKNLFYLLVAIFVSQEGFSHSSVERRPVTRLDCSQATRTTFEIDSFNGNFNHFISVSMYENPSTGYEWSSSNSEIKSEYVSDCDEPTPGCGGTRRFAIYDENITKAKPKFGKTSVFKFELGRPGEDYLTCTVKVRR